MPDAEMLGRFERRINYPSIIQHISDEEKVIMDWHQALKEIAVSKDSVWKSYDNSGGILKESHATISDFFENDDKSMKIKIHVFTDVSNKDVIGEAMLLTTYTSMMDIEIEYLKDGPGDFYIYNKHVNDGAGDSDAICVFRNVIIEISTTDDDTDVRPVVKQLVLQMTDALVKKNEVRRIKYSVLYSVQEVHKGEMFWVDIKIPSPYKIEDYLISLQYDPLPNGLEYIKNKDSQYYIKAIESGNYQFQIWIMEESTRITETAIISVAVKE